MFILENTKLTKETKPSHTYSYKLSQRNGDKRDRRYRETLLHSVCSAREIFREHEIDKRDEKIIHWKFHTYSCSICVLFSERKNSVPTPLNGPSSIIDCNYITHYSLPFTLTLIVRLVCDWNAIGARLVIPIESYTNPDTIAGESRDK